MTKTKLTTRSIVGVLVGHDLIPRIMPTQSKRSIEINYVPESLQGDLRKAFEFNRPWVRASYSTIEGFNILREIERIDPAEQRKKDTP